MLEIFLLGKPRVLVNGQAVEKFPTAKTVALLAYLGLERDGAHAREHLIALLWPEYDDKSARQNLSQTLARLRRALGPVADCIIATRKTISLSPTADVRCDVTDFLHAIEQTEQHNHADRVRCASCQTTLAQAVALVRGELLNGLQVDECDEFEHWLFFNRERVRELLLEALADLADAALAQQGYQAAVEYARQQITLEIWRERAYYQLIHALALSGERSAALHEYERLRGVLSAEFGIEPTSATRQLVEQIRTDRLHVTAVAPDNNLPASLTPFIGRNALLTEILTTIEESQTRITTIAGTGGIGKTRLALEVGRRLVDRANGRFTGVWFVPLAGVVGAENMPLAVASALNLKLPNGVQTSVAVINQLKSQQVLLILDNLEHLLIGRNWLVDLLRAAPKLQLLITSRERVKLLSENVYTLSGLAFPPPDAALEQARDYEAAVLFLDSVRRIDKRWRLNRERWTHVVALCQLLEGLPLGIELAASLIDANAVATIVEKIRVSWPTDDAILAVDYDDVAPHQRSMRAVLDQSWQRLTVVEQTALARLSVMRGAFARADALQVAAAPAIVITQLQHKSLLRASGSNQLDMHPLVRQFASAQLARQPALSATAYRTHAELYVARVGRYYRARADKQPTLRESMRRSLDNLYAAWQWAVSAEQTALLAASVNGMTRFHIDSGLFTKGDNPFQSLIDQYEARPVERLTAAERDLLTHAYVQAGGMWLDLVRDSDGGNLLDKAERILAADADPALRAMLAYHRGRMLLRQAQSDEALTILEAGLTAARHSDDRLIEGALLREIGSVYRQRGDYIKFLFYIKQALTLAQTLADTARQQTLLYFLGMYTLTVGNYWQGRAYLHEAQAIDYITRSAYHRAAITTSLGTTATLLGDYETGLRLHREGQRLLKPINEPWRMTLLLIEMAATQIALGAHDDAAKTLAEARALALQHSMVEHQAHVTLAQAQQQWATQQWQAAYEMFGEAADQMAALKRQIGVVEAVVMRAHCALQIGVALDSIALENALSFVATQRLDGAYRRELLYWTAYQVALASGASGANELLRCGRAFVKGVSAEIAEPDHRQRYLARKSVQSLLN